MQLRGSPAEREYKEKLLNRKRKRKLRLEIVSKPKSIILWAKIIGLSPEPMRTDCDRREALGSTVS
jgi:hypothetical protein